MLQVSGVLPARAHRTKGDGSQGDGMGAGPWLSLGPRFVYFSISLARTETTTWLLAFLFSRERHFPGPVPTMAAGRSPGKLELEGGQALRAASHGLSDLLTPLGLRPQALPTLVNKVAPFKAIPQ